MTHTGSPDEMPIKVMPADQAEDDPIPAALDAVKVRLDYGRQMRLELTERVDLLEAAPGPQVGPAGPIGPAGPAGPQGVAGAVGQAGPKGDTGAAGAAGPKGDAGDRGLQGVAGAAGPKGDTGATGATGAVGPAGAVGAKGDAGPAGAKGDTGAQGVQGVQGIQGEAGKPRRVDVYSAQTGLFTFPTPYSAPPTILPVATWAGLQMVIPGISAVTAASCVVTVMRSKGTLLLTAGPFEAAPGVSGQFIAIDAA